MLCIFYGSDDELTEAAADFLAEGPRLGERCWYVPTGGRSGPRSAPPSEHRRHRRIAPGTLEILASDAYIG